MSTTPCGRDSHGPGMTRMRMKATSGAQPQMCSDIAGLCPAGQPGPLASPTAAPCHRVHVTVQVAPRHATRCGQAEPNPAHPAPRSASFPLLAMASAAGIKGMRSSGQAVSVHAGWQHAGEPPPQQGGIAGSQARHLCGWTPCLPPGTGAGSRLGLRQCLAPQQAQGACPQS